jgi:glucose-6-phosphate isomerase
MIVYKKNFFKNFTNKSINSNAVKLLKNLINENNEILNSFKASYKDQFNNKLIKKLQKFKTILLIGMGGSILGSKAIYNFLIKKNNNKKFIFLDNLNAKIKRNLIEKRKLNIVISKSGNTLETVSNFNIVKNKYDKNIFVTEDNKTYLLKLANDLKSEIVHHNKFIGGRFSVLSEVGMLPAELMGFNRNKFRKLEKLINNKKFLDTVINSALSQYYFIKKNKTNSIILNYDKNSIELLEWYQQLVAESLGKKNLGILPVISNLPKDNHSIMQNYLDGPQKNFFTFFYVKEKFSNKIKSKNLYTSHNYLKKQSLDKIIFAQFCATQKVFEKKKIPYRTFIVEDRNEETIGELFIFFMLETILLAKLLKINPYDQPAVELIKKETLKVLKKS